MMGLLSASAAPPQTPEQRWSLEELKRNSLCGICYIHELNDWNSCIRRSGLINLHPGHVSRPRQMFFLIIQILKFLPIPTDYTGPIFQFAGNVPYGAVQIQDETLNPAVPTEIHNAQLICYGKKRQDYQF